VSSILIVSTKEIRGLQSQAPFVLGTVPIPCPFLAHGIARTAAQTTIDGGAMTFAVRARTQLRLKQALESAFMPPSGRLSTLSQLQA
jgi:hypothetical protein